MCAADYSLNLRTAFHWDLSVALLLRGNCSTVSLTAG